MAVNITIPKLGMSVDEVNLVEWKVREGERTGKGDTVLVIETQKTEWNVEAEASGLVHILVEAGSKATIGMVVGAIAETQEELLTLQEKTGVQSEPGPIVTTTFVTPGQTGKKAQFVEGPGGAADAEKIRITPVARKLAEEKMLDVTKITGTGPGGRITREDVEKAAAGQGPAKPVEETKAAPEAQQGKKLRESMSLRGMRKAIAEHMYRSLSGAAQMTVMGEFDMTEAVRFREGLVRNEQFLGMRISIIDILVFVISRTLMKHYDINCSFIDNELKIWDDINVGVAAAMGAEGLIVPVVRHADQKSLGEVSRAVRSMMDKAQSGALAPDDVTGGTFTLTSLGRGGVSYFQTPIINQPESAILATGPITDRPAVKEGQVVITPVMPWSLTFDHRVINGFGAEQFMGTMRRYLDEPGLLLV
jgi:pyruvate dehydrogenase E2 component (dihydrolipoamide acetyltransferase)/2-oxoglutarate dehydrogenase E2 component (dihydrolipoamide succinyltransferase)